MEQQIRTIGKITKIKIRGNMWIIRYAPLSDGTYMIALCDWDNIPRYNGYGKTVREAYKDACFEYRRS